MPRFALSWSDWIDKFIFVDGEESRLVPVGSAHCAFIQSIRRFNECRWWRRRWCLLNYLNRFGDYFVKFLLGYQVHSSVASTTGLIYHQQIFLVVMQSVVNYLLEILGDFGTRRKITRSIISFVLWCLIAYLKTIAKKMNSLCIGQFPCVVPTCVTIRSLLIS